MNNDDDASMSLICQEKQNGEKMFLKLSYEYFLRKFKN